MNNEQKDQNLHVSQHSSNEMLAEVPVRVLNLTLHKKAFEVMVTGEKWEEFRKRSKWIISRLMDDSFNPKKYDVIRFTNGYGNDKPFFVCEYEGFLECYMAVTERRYSNGLTVNDIGKGDFMIYCGKIIEVGNW